MRSSEALLYFGRKLVFTSKRSVLIGNCDQGRLNVTSELLPLALLLTPSRSRLLLLTLAYARWLSLALALSQKEMKSDETEFSFFSLICLRYVTSTTSVSPDHKC